MDLLMVEDVNVMCRAKSYWIITTENGFEVNLEHFGEQIALMHSEIDEAIEFLNRPLSIDKDKNDKPFGYFIELGDLCIRIMVFLYGNEMYRFSKRHPLLYHHEELQDCRDTDYLFDSTFLLILHALVTESCQRYRKNAKNWDSPLMKILYHVFWQAGLNDIDMFEITDRIMKYNETREHKHGGRKF